MKNALIFLLLILQMTLSYGQTLSVSYSLKSQYLTPWQDINKTSATIVTTSGSYSMASLNTLGTVSGSMTISGTPVGIQIADFGRNIGGPFAGQCSSTQNFNISFSAFCSSYSYTNQAICNLISFSVTFTPV